ncbi:MAG: beta-N-acetylhexosaminidase [Myxococcota bacterium]
MATPSASKWQPGQLLFVGFEGTSLPPDLARLIAQGRVGGVILFTRNLATAGHTDGPRQDPEAIAGLIRSIHEAAPPDLPTMIAIDQEGGRVQRMAEPWTRWPPMRRLGEVADDRQTTAVAEALATELLDAGIALDFTPVVDVDTNLDNPVIGDRSFGRTPEVVARHAAIVIQAMQARGVATCAKHFPGHGDTVSDSHHELPRLPHDLDRLRAVELPPFAAAIAAGVSAIMTAHVVFEAIDAKRPATLSPDVINVLREELGYDGLVFSDDLEMRAVADHYRPRQIVDGALGADVDALLVCRHSGLRDEVLGALEAQPDARIERAVERMVGFKAAYAERAREIALGEDRRGPPYEAHQRLARALEGG